MYKKWDKIRRESKTLSSRWSDAVMKLDAINKADDILKLWRKYLEDGQTVEYVKYLKKRIEERKKRK